MKTKNFVLQNRTAYMAMAPGKWSLSDMELSGRFPHKERLPKMRELREDLNDQIG